MIKSSRKFHDTSSKVYRFSSEVFFCGPFSRPAGWEHVLVRSVKLLRALVRSRSPEAEVSLRSERADGLVQRATDLPPSCPSTSCKESALA